MFARQRYTTPYEYHWNHFSINRLLFAVVLLTSSVKIIADNVNSKEGRSSHEINCTIYTACAQCAVASNCSWLMEKQSCFHSDQSLPLNSVVNARESCPKFTVKTPDAYSVQVTVTNIAVKGVKTYFDNSATVACEVEKNTFNASFDNGIITCDLKEQVASAPMFVRYFSIVVDGVRLKFNDPRDHYVSYADCPDENCAVGYWESGPRKYYCKWCLRNRGCQTAAEAHDHGCDVRNRRDNERVTGGASESTIVVESADVAIASFAPDALLYVNNRPAVVSITVKNHRILADGRSTTVTVAGHRCVDPITVDGQTVNCTIMYDERDVVVHEGPVQVEYARPASVLRLRSAQTFRFVDPSVTDVSPVCVPVSGGTRIKLTGEHLNVADRVRVLFDDPTKETACDIVAVARNRIDCVTRAATNGPQTGALLMIYDEVIFNFYTKKMFVYVADPSVRDGQVFAGVASGGVPLTVRGRFECTENPHMYVYYNGKNHYGHCAPHHTTNGTASAMDCWPPKLDGPAQVTSLMLGFQVDMAGKTVHLQPPSLYFLHPDQVYADFEVLENNGTVRVTGKFPDPLQRRQPDGNYLFVVTFGCADAADGEENCFCTVTDVTENRVECLAPSGTSVADVQQIEIVVGKQVKPTTVYRRYNAFVKLLRLDYIVGSISCLMICVFAVIYCVRNSKKRIEQRYLEELRNITAGIDDSTDY